MFGRTASPARRLHYRYRYICPCSWFGYHRDSRNTHRDQCRLDAAGRDIRRYLPRLGDWPSLCLSSLFLLSLPFLLSELKMTSGRIAGNGDAKGVRFSLLFYPFTFLPLKRQVALIYFLYGSCGIVAITSVRYSLPSALLAGGECLPSFFLFWGENNNVTIIITVW